VDNIVMRLRSLWRKRD